MIVSPRFVWIHMPKTGGTWLRELLKKTLHPALLGEVIYPGHHSIREVALPKRQVPILWVIRNPWEWHVSRFCFWRQHYLGRTGGYSVHQSRWTDADRWWAKTLAPNPTFAEALPKMLKFRTFSWFAKDLVMDEEGDVVVQPRRFEHLREELLEFFQGALGESMPAELERQLKHSPPENISRHRPYRSYYGENEVQLVREVDGEWAERYGYEF